MVIVNRKFQQNLTYTLRIAENIIVIWPTIFNDPQFAVFLNFTLFCEQKLNVWISLK